MTLQLTITRLASPAELVPLRDDWNRLAAGSPFRRWEWLEAWFRHYGTTDDELFTLAVHDEMGRMVGLAPWYRARSFRLGRVLRFLGGGEVCSDHLTILAEPGRETDVLTALGDWLAKQARNEWDLLELTGVDTNDPLTSALLANLQSHGHRLHSRPGLSTWQLPLPATLDAIVNDLSRSRRDKARKILRKVFGTGRAVSHRVESATELERGFEILIDLHQRRWQAAGLPGCFASDRFCRFQREVAERFLATGDLRLHWVEIEGRPVSVAYEFLSGTEVACYQMGYDPEFAHESPGWLQVLSSLRMAIESGARTFDFLRGDEPYKASWGCVGVPTTEYRVVGSSSTAQVRHVAWRTEQHLRDWVRQWRSRTSENRTVTEKKSGVEEVKS